MKKTYSATISSLLVIMTTYSVESSIDHIKLRARFSEQPVDARGNPAHSSIKIAEVIPTGKRYGVCHHYAISKKLNILGKISEILPIDGSMDWYEEFDFLGNYCAKVVDPQQGDLAIYTSDDGRHVLHTGLVVGEDLIESKWGRTSYSFIHPSFMVPYHYGNNIHYYRLINSSDEIIADINRRSAISVSEKRHSKNHALISFVMFSGLSGKGQVKQILEEYMDADVNTMNSCQQTLLMIAINNNDYALARMLIKYKADTNKQDGNGRTALHYAGKKGSYSMMKNLMKQKCNGELKDRFGKTAFDYYYDRKLSSKDYIARHIDANLSTIHKHVKNGFWYS